MSDNRYKIIGGGISGLASALAVANVGAEAVVFEKSKAFDIIGAGIQLGPNAAHALQKLGAWEAVAPYTFAPAELYIRNGLNGKILYRMVLGKSFEARFGKPYLTAHRADLHNALLQTIESQKRISITTQAEVTTLSNEGFDAVIAADGIRSKARTNLFPGSEAKSNRDTYFRKMFELPAGPSGIDFSCINLWLYPGGHVVHYPVGQPLKVNLVAITQGDEPSVHFEKACSDLQDILNISGEFTKWQSAYVAPLDCWHKQNVTLIGDAAHGTQPYLAQGAAMSLEDAAVLQFCLQKKNTMSKTFEDLFSLRHKRTTRLHHATLNVGRAHHMAGLGAIARNIAFNFISESAMINRLSWIYDWNI